MNAVVWTIICLALVGMIAEPVEVVWAISCIPLLGMIAEVKDAACLSHAARRWLPPSRTGKPAHTSVLMRWADKGIKSANGERVYLKTWRVGGQRMTSQAAIEEFLLALNSGTPAAQESADADYQRRAKEAGQALEKLGC